MPPASRRPWILIALSFLLFGIGCGSDDGIVGEPFVPEHTITALGWETTGGGDLSFVILRSGENFHIDVERRDFQALDVEILLTMQDPAVHSLVEALFEQRLDVHDFTFVPQGETGTWTTIRLGYAMRSAETIENVDPTGLLRQLYTYVWEAAGD